MDITQGLSANPTDAAVNSRAVPIQPCTYPHAQGDRQPVNSNGYDPLPAAGSSDADLD